MNRYENEFYNNRDSRELWNVVCNGAIRYDAHTIGYVWLEKYTIQPLHIQVLFQAQASIDISNENNGFPKIWTTTV